MIGRDPRGLEVAYRRYAGPLYAYSRALLADPHAAADIVHDTFVLANSRVRQLRDPDLLRPWLYAIARNECRRAVRARRRTATLDLAGDPAAEEPDPETAAQAGELVRAAVASLGSGDRTVIELALRHHLSAIDVGAALGIATNHAHARLSRARAQFERALDALLIARARGADCPALRQVLGEWRGRLTPLLRKRVNRHIDGCDACDACRPRGVPPPTASAVVAAYTAGVLPAEQRRRAAAGG